MKKILYSLVIITLLVNTNAQSKKKDWISNYTYFETDPFLISFVDDSLLKVYNANMDSRILKYYNVTNDSLRLLDNNELYGIIIFTNENEIKLQIENIDYKFEFFPLDIVKPQTYPLGSIKTRLNFKGLWETQMQIGNQMFNCKFDFLDSDYMIFIYSSLKDHVNNVSYQKWDLIDYNSVIILRLFDSNVRYFIVNNVFEDKITLSSVNNLVKISLTKKQVDNDYQLESILSNNVWRLTYEFKKEPVLPNLKNYLNYNNLFFNEGSYNFSRFIKETDSSINLYGVYQLSSDFKFISFSNLRNDLFKIELNNSKDKIILNKVNSVDNFKIVLNRNENIFLLPDTK